MLGSFVTSVAGERVVRTNKCAHHLAQHPGPRANPGRPTRTSFSNADRPEKLEPLIQRAWVPRDDMLHFWECAAGS
ncbi:hypothetical protein GGTG_10534 [Gaeumannomyces tritici R3-111a-1]|uniref:Uncharacterized protein n=1 Tax=Gaeumannomyces tritici (strain R3-111a-1) TaxID=644352 RepID=J3PAK9_GAET3|nr:hypothetical protein GGTG_10534 [Gaeumannomyces tritici R3-111a-1]EJT71275.1 hypothetical protein GGTG_10534 [Gaeumannomyces tritici R3-111a-1]